MGWNFDKPLYSMSSEQEQNDMIRLWESEKHGGLWMGNNRLPLPLTYLIALIIITSFLMTMPLWGQRPTADIYLEMVKNMNSAEIQALATPEEKMKRLFDIAYSAADGRTQGLLVRHPITFDDLLLIAPGIIEAQKSGAYPLNNYNVVADKILLANFEGNYREDGKRERIQPWWDKGYTIDVFYVSYFLLTIVLICKRLPHHSKKPNMAKAA